MFRHSTITPLLVAAAFQLKLVLGWNRTDCAIKVNQMARSNDSSLNPAWILSLADPNNPILTVEGCEAICDSKMGFYPDSPPRLITWLLPVIFLIGSMQFAPIGKKRFLMVLHLLGDPIHSTWSLLVKLEDWHRCLSYIRAQYPQNPSPKQEYRMKSSVMVLAVAEELLVPWEIRNRLFSSVPDARFDHILRETASALIESRKTELLRTIFTILWYIFEVMAAFVPAVGQSTAASAGRIAPAMLLSWLLPFVLLSNAIGGFSSLRNCEFFISRYLAHIGKSNHDISICEEQRSRFFKKEETAPYFSSLAWSGAICSYRLGKRPSANRRRGLLLALCSVVPVIFAFGLALATLETAPTYFSCRSVLVTSIFASWLISAIITCIASFQSIITGRYLWNLILIKDAFIAVPALIFIIVTSCGLFNNCSCWSGALVHGRSKASVALNPVSAFNRNNGVIYPAMVATGLFLQISVFILILWAGWRCFRVMRGSNDMWPESNPSTQTQAPTIGTLPVTQEESAGDADPIQQIQPQIDSSQNIAQHEKEKVVSQEKSVELVTVVGKSDDGTRVHSSAQSSAPGG